MSGDLEKIDKKYILINENTGELFPVTNKEALGIVYREQLKETQSNKKEGYEKKKVKDEFKKYINENYGSFYFNFYNLLQEKNLRAQDQFRFIYLCTYMNYQGVLMVNNRRKFTRKDFDKILNLSRKETIRTLNNLREEGLIIEQDGVFKINKRISLRGKLSKKEKLNEYSRLFDSGVREMYTKSLPKEHKLLSVFIQLLPYVNYDYNIVCENPKETNKDLVMPYKFKDLAQILGYSNPTTLKKDLLSLKIGTKKAIVITLSGGDRVGIYINPALYYKGNNRKSLEALEILFK